MAIRDLVRALRSAFRRGEPTAEPAATIELRDLVTDRSARTAAQLAADLSAGRIALPAFQSDLYLLTRNSFISQFALGRGGAANLTDADRDALSRMLSEQAKALRQFTRDIATNTLTAEQIAQRAAMYPDSAIEAHSRGTAAAMGLALPEHPPAHVRCRCYWERAMENGEAVAYWRTAGDDRVCPICIDLAAQYQPWRPAA